MKEAPDSSETSVLTRATRRNNPEDTILHSHRRENLKSYRTLPVIVGDCDVREIENAPVYIWIHNCSVKPARRHKGNARGIFKMPAGYLHISFISE
jgi:hypothetical protein